MKRSLYSIQLFLVLIYLLLFQHTDSIHALSNYYNSNNIDTTKHDLLPRDRTEANSNTSKNSSQAPPQASSSSPSASNHTFHYKQTTVNRTAAFNIDYQLNCKVDDPFCAKVENGIRLALQEFANVVDLKTKINVNITYHSFCDNGCANNSYGFGVPSSQFTLPFDSGPDLNHVYPQALAKQFVRSFDTSSVWAASDVTIEINHDAYMQPVDYGKAEAMGWNGTGTPPTGRFWFVNDTSYSNEDGDSTSSITENQVDFRYVFLHELLHGLGFLSSWAAYFWSSTSPFRQLVENALDDDMLKVVTPGMYWSVAENYGPTFITGFQSTLIYDKFLVSYNPNDDTNSDSQLPTNISQLGFSMQNFCQQDTQSFVLNFITAFQNSPQYSGAVHLWNAMTVPNTLFFNFTPPTVRNSTFWRNEYLRTTYQNMTLLTGTTILDKQLEQFDQTSSRPGTAISHVDDAYNSTVDFIMTKGFLMGSTLEDLTAEMYQAIPPIRYDIITSNNSIVTRNYTSPIGPGILRMLDTMGYSTALTNTSYVSTGVRTAKFRSPCDDINDSSGSGGSSNSVASNPTVGNTNDGSTMYSAIHYQWFILLVWITVPLLS